MTAAYTYLCSNKHRSSVCYQLIWVAINFILYNMRVQTYNSDDSRQNISYHYRSYNSFYKPLHVSTLKGHHQMRMHNKDERYWEAVLLTKTVFIMQFIKHSGTSSLKGAGIFLAKDDNHHCGLVRRRQCITS